MSADTPIEAGSRVSLFFSLALTDGQEIDSNFEASPASFKLGDGSMLPGFEARLLGYVAGQEAEVLLPAEQAFGEVNPKNRQQFSRDKFAHLLADDLLPTEVGSVVSFKDPAGFELPGVVQEITPATVTVDFNHPLAGKDIRFRFRIVSVLPPAEEPVQVKL
jgi:FKBP-type peptidyl-prolyl cis-trans isomerase SlpA